MGNSNRRDTCDTPVRYEQQTEATNHTGSPKLDNKTLEEKVPGLMSLDFCCNIQEESEFKVNNMETLINPASFRLLVIYSDIVDVIFLDPLAQNERN